MYIPIQFVLILLLLDASSERCIYFNAIKYNIAICTNIKLELIQSDEIYLFFFAECFEECCLQRSIIVRKIQVTTIIYL